MRLKISDPNVSDVLGACIVLAMFAIVVAVVGLCSINISYWMSHGGILGYINYQLETDSQVLFTPVFILALMLAAFCFFLLSLVFKKELPFDRVRELELDENGVTFFRSFSKFPIRETFSYDEIKNLHVKMHTRHNPEAGVWLDYVILTFVLENENVIGIKHGGNGITKFGNDKFMSDLLQYKKYFKKVESDIEGPGECKKIIKYYENPYDPTIFSKKNTSENSWWSIVFMYLFGLSSIITICILIWNLNPYGGRNLPVLCVSLFISIFFCIGYFVADNLQSEKEEE